MLKYLRIAVTTLSLTACVLLIALWVRSYWHGDGIYFRLLGSPKIGMASVYGCVAFGYEHEAHHGSRSTTSIETDSINLQIETWATKQIETAMTASKFNLATFPGGRRLVVPSYFAVLITFMNAALTAKPWVTWRFSLRTLLIATTLVAVGLGIVVVSS